MTVKEVMSNRSDLWEQLKKDLFKHIKQQGINFRSDIRYIAWEEKQIYLFIWCGKFLMASKFDEKFERFRGLSDLEPTYEELLSFIEQKKTS